MRTTACGGLFFLVAVLSTPAQADVAHRRNAVTEVVQKVAPAVVYIGTEQIIEPRSRLPRDSFFDRFLGMRRERRQAVHSLGSGVILDPSGVVVTNDHVIRGASAIHVVLADGRQLEAEVIGSDADNDLAVLRVPAKGSLPAAKLGTSSDLMIGETAIAIGSPFGLQKTVTVGVISAVGRSFKAEDRVFNDFVQTDASINPGNSGGPLINIDGEVIGINTAIYASGQGIGFAIPADKVRRIVAELTQFGKVRPAWIGIDAGPISPQLAKRLGWDRSYGAVVTQVDPESPAATAGVQRGDIIEEIGGSRVENPEDLAVQLRGYPARTSLSMAIFRNGTTRKMNITAVEFQPKLAEAMAWDRLGIEVKASKGALVISRVRNDSEADRVGLEAGDLVLRINNKLMNGMEAFREALIAARTSSNVVFVIGRGGWGYYVPLHF